MSKSSTENVVEQKSTAEEDLALIRKMMLEAQSSAAIDGRHLVLWGSILGFAQALVLLNIGQAGDAGRTILIWFVLLGAGIVGSAILGYKYSQRPVNLAVRLYSSVWIGFCLTMCLLFVLAVAGHQEILFSLSVVAPAMTGLAFFVTASIIGMGWLRWIALCWWLTAIASAVFSNSSYLEYIFIFAYLFLMAGPGLVMTRSGRRA
tara:strand:- start:616 stop:1230 length:615 start_codon:yes stop_codon:yes gene_type:complete